MADFGLYAALRGTDNWAQRRQSKINDMLMLTEMENQAKAKQQEAMAAEEGINKYFDEITQLQSEYLPEDAERIKQVEKSARENIIKGISAFNGDLSRYVSSGGITDLHTYKNSILQSKEVRNAQLNKVNFGALMKDFQDGNKYIKDVEVKIPLMDENGERKVDEKGNPLLEVKKVSGEEAIKLFRDNKIDFLPYNGSEDVEPLNSLTFSQFFKDPLNPASKDNIVTGGTIHSYLTNKGKSKEYADKVVKNYYDVLKAGGETWKFKALSEEELALMEAKKNKSSGGGSKENKSPYRDIYYDAITGKGQGNVQKGSAKEWKTKTGTIGNASYTTHTVSSEILKELANQIGLDMSKIDGSEIYDKDGNVIDAEKIINPKKLASGEIYSPRSGSKVNLDGLNYTVTNVSPKIHRIDGESFVEATIYIDEPSLEEAGIRELEGFDKINNEWKSLVTKMGGGGMDGENYSVKTFIKLNDSPSARDRGTKNILNAQWKEDTGVEGQSAGMGLGKDEIGIDFRQYYE